MRDEVGTHPQRCVITRAIGVDTDVEVDTFVTEVTPGDQVLLCSDGLWGSVSDAMITEQLAQNAISDAVPELVEVAGAHGRQIRGRPGRRLRRP